MAKFNEYTKQIDLSEDDKEMFREIHADLCNGPREAFKRRFPNLTQAFDDNFVGWKIKEPGFINIKGERLMDYPEKREAYSCPIGAYFGPDGCVYPDDKK